MAAPSAPALPTLTATNNSITASWDAPASDSPITFYELQWRVGETGALSQISGIFSRTRTISGRPQQTEHRVRVRARSSEGSGAWSEWASITTQPTGLAPVLLSASALEYNSGTTANIVLDAASSGDPPITYTLSGLPSGLTFDAASRTIGGSTSALGEYTLTYRATDTDGSFAVQTLTLRVLLSLNDIALPSGHGVVDATLVLGNRDSSNFLYRSDGTPTGSLLVGDLTPEDGYPLTRIRHTAANQFQINDNPDTRNISTFFGSSGAGYQLTILIQDSQGSASFAVASAGVIFGGANGIVFRTSNEFNAVVNRIQSNDRFILAFTSPIAPLNLQAAPTYAGSFTVSKAELSLEDPPDLELRAARSYSGTFTVPTAILTSPESLTSEDLDDIFLEGGVYFELQLQEATGGTGPYQYELIGRIPAGLTYTGSTRVLAGRPTQGGVFPLRYRITDDTNFSAEVMFSITVVLQDSQRLFEYRFEVSWDNTGNFDPDDPAAEFSDIYPDIVEEFSLERGREFKTGYSVVLAGSGSLIVRNDDDQYTDYIDNRDLKPECRWQMRIADTWHTLWRGIVDNVEEITDRPGFRLVEFQVMGILSNLVVPKISTSMNIDVPISQAFQNALTLAELGNRWIGSIESTRTLDRWWISDEEVQDVMEVLERTEYGTTIENREGNIVLQSTDHRERTARQGGNLLFSADQEDRDRGAFEVIKFEYEIPRWNVVNSIRVQIRKYDTSPEAVLWSLSDPLELPGNETTPFIISHMAGGRGLVSSCG